MEILFGKNKLDHKPKSYYSLAMFCQEHPDGNYLMEDIENGAYIFCDAKSNKYGPQNVCSSINRFIKIGWYGVLRYGTI
jgi:hypothetical protein